MKWIQAIAILSFLKIGTLSAQSLQVYPGDVTNNGVVNNLDFLHLGMAYNYAGPARISASQIFEPQAAFPWSYQFANGLNMAYADCNGDGVVNYYYDAFPLYTNYGLQRNNGITPDVFIAGVPDVDPPLRFDHAAAPAQVQGGQLLNLPIELGTIDNPAEDLYGIAFSMIIDPMLIDANTVMFDLSESSWANPDNDRIWMYKKVSSQRIDVAWVRTDKNQKRGFGKIGSVGFVIIVDILPLQQTFPISIENIKMMDKYGNYATVAGDTLWLTVPPDSAVAGTHTVSNDPQVSVMPNPANDRMLIRASETITGVVLADLLGQIVYTNHTIQSSFTELTLPNLPSGTYLLRIETEKGTSFRRLQIQR
jgi:hypothetical protein